MMMTEGIENSPAVQARFPLHQKRAPSIKRTFHLAVKKRVTEAIFAPATRYKDIDIRIHNARALIYPKVMTLQ